jgi:Gas vesicle synthesis protein GvpL/GvpF
MTSGYYVYGLTRADKDVDFGCIGLQHDGQPGRVFTVRVDSVATVVSQFALPAAGGSPAREKVLPLFRNMRPYHDVLCEVMKTTTIAPMRFGHLAASREAIEKAVLDNRDHIEDLLARIDGAVEMDLQVKWGVDNVFAHFVETDPELRDVRDRVFGASAAPSFEDRIAVGEIFAEKIAAHRDEQRARVEERLRSCCRELRALAPRSEELVVALACLVDRASVPAFLERVQEVAAEFPPAYVFEYSGPLPPFNFVEPDL